jgi:hypothetical protein
MSFLDSAAVKANVCIIPRSASLLKIGAALFSACAHSRKVRRGIRKEKANN